MIIQSKLGTVIDIEGAKTAPGTGLDAYSHNGNANQQWEFAPTRPAPDASLSRACRADKLSISRAIRGLPARYSTPTRRRPPQPETSTNCGGLSLAPPDRATTTSSTLSQADS